MRLYNLQIPIIAITGGAASGKSTVSKYFQTQGQLVLSADEIITGIYATQEMKDWLEENYPRYLVNGVIEKKALSKRAFADPEMLNSLESFLYPKMEKEFLKRLPENLPSFLLYEIPLLFEKKKEDFVDSIILVTCSTGFQLKRLMKRNELTEQQAQNIIQNQMPWKLKKDRSHFIIENNGDLESLEKNCQEVLNKLKEKFQ